MHIRLICVCGRLMSLPEKYAGQHVQCPQCEAMLRIPTREEDLGLIRWFCDCGQRLKARRRSAGRKVRCPRCGNQSAVPELDEAESLLSEEFLLDDKSGVVQLAPQETTEQLASAQPAVPEPIEADIGPEESPLELVSLDEPVAAERVPSAGPSAPAEEEPVAAEVSADDDDGSGIYDLAVPQPLPKAPLQVPPAPAPTPVAVGGMPRTAAAEYEEEEEGIAARDLSRYFNVRSGKDAAVAGVSQVLNGYWLYIPYALLGGCATNILQIATASTEGRTAMAFVWMGVSFLFTIYLWAAFAGCVKDGIFERSMGIERLLHHGAAHFLYFGGTVLLMIPVGLVLGILAAAGVAGAWVALPGLWKVLVVIVTVVGGVFFFTLLFLPPVVAVLEKTNPLFAVGKGLLFGFKHIGSLISLALVSMLIGGGIVLIIGLFYWLASLLLFFILPPWLFDAVGVFVGGIVGGAILGQLTSAIMLLYLSDLDEDKLEEIHENLRGPRTRPRLLFAAIAVLAIVMLGTNYYRFRKLGAFRFRGRRGAQSSRLDIPARTPGIAGASDPADMSRPSDA